MFTTVYFPDIFGRMMKAVTVHQNLFCHETYSAGRLRRLVADLHSGSRRATATCWMELAGLNVGQELHDGFDHLHDPRGSIATQETAACPQGSNLA